MDSTIIDIVTRVVFGKRGNEMPSPIQELRNAAAATRDGDDSAVAYWVQERNIRTLLIGCKGETFGIPVLNATFCSEEYAGLLNALNSKKEEKEKEVARYVPLSYTANHWTVLDSEVLMDAMAEHLPWLVAPASHNTKGTK